MRGRGPGDDAPPVHLGGVDGLGVLDEERLGPCALLLVVLGDDHLFDFLEAEHVFEDDFFEVPHGADGVVDECGCGFGVGPAADWRLLGGVGTRCVGSFASGYCLMISLKSCWWCIPIFGLFHEDIPDELAGLRRAPEDIRLDTVHYGRVVVVENENPWLCKFLSGRTCWTDTTMHRRLFSSAAVRFHENPLVRDIRPAYTLN